MFRTKKDLDLHARDILSKVTSENEKAKRSLPLARAYFAMKEYQTAFRYIENYMAKEINNDAAYKLKGDILSELDQKEEAFECYKSGYQFGKSRECLSKVCDLLSTGYGKNENPSSRKKWFDLLSQEPSTTLKILHPSSSSSFNNLNGSGTGESESRLYSVRNQLNSNSGHSSNTYDLTPRQSSHHVNHETYDLTLKSSRESQGNSWNKKIFNNGGSSHSKINYPGTHDKETLTRLFDQNSQLIEMVKRIEGEVQELKVFGLAAPNSFSSPPSLNKSLIDMNLNRQEEREKYEENLNKLCEQNSKVIDILTRHEDTIKDLKFKLDKLTIESSNFKDSVDGNRNLPGIASSSSSNISLSAPPSQPGIGANQGVVGPGVYPYQYPPQASFYPPQYYIPPPPPELVNQLNYLTNPYLAAAMYSGMGLIGAAGSPATSTPNSSIGAPTPTPGNPNPTTQNPIPFSFITIQSNKEADRESDSKSSPSSSPPSNPMKSVFSISNGNVGCVLKESSFGAGTTEGAGTTFSFSKGLFGSSPSTPLFGSTTSSSPIAISQEKLTNEKPRTTSESEENPEGFVPNVEFEPVIPLPPLVEAKKGDENETLIHEVRAKILRFDKDLKEWKERGVGNIKILQNNDDQYKIRIVMWREQVFKLACNHYLEKGMVVDFFKGSQKAIFWSCLDFAEEEPKKEIFVCKFGNEEKCLEFKKNMEKMIEFLNNKVDDPKEAKSNGGNANPTNVANSQKRLSELFKKEEGSWSCDSCYCTNKKTESVCVACQSPNPSNKNAIVTPKKDQQGPTFTSTPSFSFGITPKKDETPSTISNLFGTSAILSTPGFGDLAAKNTSFGSGTGTGSSPFTFTKGFFNAGTPVFGVSPAPTQTQQTGSLSTERQRTTSTDEHPDEFVPTVDFQPVIPLPPLVEVKKGDENETLIHEVRAKVLRFDKDLKEWKERGVGNIKILQNNDDQYKIRIVMWREQVFKLACNHYLEKGMVVENYSGNEKAIMWSALDFAEEEPKKEIFVCKFGNEEKCLEFKKHMENMIKFLDNKSDDHQEVKSDCGNPKPTNVANSQKPLSELFKKEEGSWSCDSCYCTNKKTESVCVACQSPNPANKNAVTPKKDQPTSTPTPAFSFGFTPKKDESTPSTTMPNLFGGTPVFSTSTPGFGDLAAKNTSYGSSESACSPFTFTKGFFNAGTPVFGASPAPTQTQQTGSLSTERQRTTSTDEHPDEFVPTVDFQPVIPLPPLVEVKKGDENETLIHEVRAKVLRFDKDLKEWKERGVGNIKILQNNDDQYKIRIVMWREQVFKLACNHYLEKGMVVENYSGNEKAIMWSALDFAEEEPKKEIFVCKFGNEEKCLEFKKHMEKMIQFLDNKIDNPKEDKSDCGNPKPTNVANSQKPLSELFKKEEGSWSCDSCYCANKKTESVCVACQSPNPANKNAVTPKKDQPTSTPTPAFSFGFTPKKDESTPSTTMPNLFGGTPVFSTSTPGFGDLAAKSTSFGSSTGSSSFSFKGFFDAGAPVFGGSSAQTGSPGERQRTTSGTDEHPDEFVPTADFQPVIPLPPLVEVKKGDENETLIHEVRAKVLRFDKDLKEWKERGVGNLKLLQDKEDQFKIRIVMWREQVLKLACNHMLDKDLKVDFFNENPKTLMWTAMDYSEATPQSEIFVARFGNEDKCKDFRNHMERMIKFLSEKTEGGIVEGNKSDLIAKAERLQLPPNFYDYEDEKFTPCAGCIGCDPDNFDFSKLEGRVVPDFSLEEPSSSLFSMTAAAAARFEEAPQAQQEEDDDDEDLMFENEANFFVREYEFGIDFTDLGPGIIKIYYDGDQFCARLIFNNLDGLTLIDHYIAAETNVNSAGNLTFEWDGVNMTEDYSFKSRMRVVFPDQQAFDAFSSAMSDSVDLAMQAGVTEGFLLGNEIEDPNELQQNM